MPDLKRDHLAITVLNNGAVGQIMSDGMMVNQITGNELDGSMMNLYLRIRRDDGWHSTAILGPHSQSHVSVGKTSATWLGDFEDAHYRVQLRLGQHERWYWHATATNNTDALMDFTYLQDLGLGTPSYVTSNEAYATQYLDHYVETDPIAIGSRQNQSQDGAFPYLQQGGLTALKSFETDGFQFFTSQYRETGVPEALLEDQLANEKMQYECGLVALRTVAQEKTLETIFYAAFVADQPNDNNRLLVSQDELKQEYHNLSDTTAAEIPLSGVIPLQTIGQPLRARHMSTKEIEQRYPKRLQEERLKDSILSFFTPDAAHTVLPAKEVQQQRLTGNIIMAQPTITPTTPVMASTQFMPGIFESHSVFGNTNMQPLTTHTRDALNFFKVNGTRIYIKDSENQYRLLGMPSAYTMHPNGGEWRYLIDDDELVVTDDANTDQPQLTLHFYSVANRRYDIMVTTQWNRETMGQKPEIKWQPQGLTLQPSVETPMRQMHPDLGYQVQFGDVDKLGDEHLLIGNASQPIDLFVACYQQVVEFTIRTGLKGHELQQQSASEARQKHLQFVEDVVKHVQVTTDNIGKKDLVEQTNLIIRWYAHDALVHLLSPHGLEQYGGAAWGTRDVSQGPTEFFAAFGHNKQIRELIVTIYQHQFVETGNWAQWFMYDEYAASFADESHGDVIVWPLKVVVDYLLATHDYGILDESLTYMSQKTKQSTQGKASLRQHITKQLQYITNNFLPGTSVSAYGDGDWDDTLQPANAEQKKTMASTWTEELTIETLRKASEAFSGDADLGPWVTQLATDMMQDFKTYFMQDDVLPGFIRMDAAHHVTPIIHPNDQVTGIDYRLLPLSQGVLSGILEGSDKKRALDLIETHLLFPDGVRLMDRPSTYHGGVSRVFKRAEQAANFGREIGLLYVHAHIRYSDAVAVSGDPDKSWQLLQLVNPIQLQHRVKNAALRQANTYFSSSDADFMDRYEAQENFDQVREQSIPVKGGWRLYSSGPGIFIGTLMRSVFGFGNNETFNLDRVERPLPFDSDIRVMVSSKNQ
ncbi:GH36-type glycosyl hydrolase domain-containing protein [Lacticaseibacillus saniviri]